MAKTIADQNLIKKIQKPKTRRGKRILEKREPQLIEDVKRAVLCRCSTANQKGVQMLKDFYAIKKPNAVFLNRKESWQPFNDVSSLEFVAKKNDSALFAYVSNSKKRPNNIVIGRTYDGNVLDMAEFEFNNYLSLSEFQKPKITLGTKPIILFSGQMFETMPNHQRLKSLLLDFFIGPNVEQINLHGLEHVIHFIEIDGIICMRSYRILLKKSGSRLPRVELEEIGPRVDFTLRRNQFAQDDLFKKALKQPDAVLRQQGQKRKPEEKNISVDAFGTTLGRIHMEQQDYSKLQLRKGGAFKVKKIIDQ
ncbi:rRNA-binding ribosome biosynthesis protein rpf2 [Dermatophagoides farinae]|uniref:Ribosome production factor 2 homolog n=1 Tax=Dermatophagoides farinae TaxID=6954 RepID=A0A922HEJ0_DERFA|nr:rRNA-binding ribosome biosynthesis protein rpf2 [Dermatophagoides farinae]